MKKQGLLALLFTLIVSVLVAGCGGGTDTTPQQGADTGTKTEAKEFTVGLIPAETKISDETLEKFRSYLEKETGMTVKMANYPDYNGVVEALNHGKLNMAYLGPLTYVVAHHKSGAKANLAVKCHEKTS